MHKSCLKQKMFLGLLVLFLFQIQPVTAAFGADSVKLDPANFPDPVFLEYLERYDQNHDGAFSESEIKMITSLNVSAMNVQTLEGIQYFTSLEELNCYNNQIDQLDLQFNTSLRTVNCGKNKLEGLELSQNSNIISLNCSDNQITELDIRHLAGIEQLYVSNNRLKNLEIERAENLKQLYCSGNEITELHCELLKKLVRLDCSKNKLTYLNLMSAERLEYINSSNNQITEINLKDKMHLLYVLLNHNEISNLSLGEMPLLEELYASDNEIEKLDLSGCPELKVLSCYNNKIEDLDLKKSPGLKTIHCYNNQLLCLNLENQKNLNSWSLSPQTRKIAAWNEAGSWGFTLGALVLPENLDRIHFGRGDVDFASQTGKGTLYSAELPKTLSYTYENKGNVDKNGMKVTLLFEETDQVYKISFAIRPGDEAYGSVFYDSLILPAGSKIPESCFKAVPKKSSAFDGWYHGGIQIQPGNEIVKTAVQYEARFYPDENQNGQDDRAETVLVRFRIEDGQERMGKLTCESYQVPYGGKIPKAVCSVYAESRYTFSGWYLEGERTDPFAVVIKTPTVFTARFQAKPDSSGDREEGGSENEAPPLNHETLPEASQDTVPEASQDTVPEAVPETLEAESGTDSASAYEAESGTSAADNRKTTEETAQTVRETGQKTETINITITRLESEAGDDEWAIAADTAGDEKTQDIQEKVSLEPVTPEEVKQGKDHCYRHTMLLFLVLVLEWLFIFTADSDMEWQKRRKG